MNGGFQTTPTRSQWIDTAKGITITLVTLHHVVSGLWAAGELPESFYRIYALGEPIRMPLFFLVAGLFASKALKSDWPRFFDGKILHFMYFYVIWNMISLLMRWVFGAFTNNEVDPLELLYIGWKPVAMLWFLYVLALAFLYIRLLDRAGPVYQTLIAAFLMGVSFHIPSTIEVPQMFCRMLIFFVIGTHASELVREIVESRSRLLFPLGAVLFVGLAWLIARERLMSEPLVFFLAATAASYCIMSFAHLATGTMVGRLFNWIGQYSLYIYVMNFLPTAGVRPFLIRFGLVDYPLVAVVAGTIFSLLFCILAYFVVVRTPLKFIVERPHWLKVDGRIMPRRSHLKEADLPGV